MDYNYQRNVTAASPEAAQRALIKAEEAYLIAMGWKKHPKKSNLWTPASKSIGAYDPGDGLSRQNAVETTKDANNFPRF